jgi:MYXO-CTERM domain-containing protein
MSNSNGVTVEDIRAKAREVEEAVKQTQETAKQGATWAVGGLVLLVLVVFFLGRRRGRKGGAIVEVYKV